MSAQYKNMTYEKPAQPSFIKNMLSGNARSANNGREPIPERPIDDTRGDEQSDEEGDEAPLVVQVKQRDLSQAEVERGGLDFFVLMCFTEFVGQSKKAKLHHRLNLLLKNQ